MVGSPRGAGVISATPLIFAAGLRQLFTSPWTPALLAVNLQVMAVLAAFH